MGCDTLAELGHVLELVKEGGALASLTVVTCVALWLAHRERRGD